MVSVEPFVICRMAAGPKQSFAALDFTALHYAVAGSGVLSLSGQTAIVLGPGSMVIVPSSAVESMGLGSLAGIAALSKEHRAKEPKESDDPPEE